VKLSAGGVVAFTAPAMVVAREVAELRGDMLGIEEWEGALTVFGGSHGRVWQWRWLPARSCFSSRA
jgi:protein-S-isoprenylcysteine O-methyltransferase Ste14